MSKSFIGILNRKKISKNKIKKKRIFHKIFGIKNRQYQIFELLKII